MNGLTHRTVETNGIRMHVAEQGEGPLVLMCHGFPESWYSWRHQLPALAEAGFRAVAPDMRGYGQTDQPREIDQYTLLHSIGDMVGLLDALGAEGAVIAGHDWGAPLAWAAAVLRPDRFRGVIALSGPFGPRGSIRPTTVMPQSGDTIFYQLYFQRPGVAEAEFERNVRLTIRSILCSISGDAPRLVGSVADRNAVGMVHREAGFLARWSIRTRCHPGSPKPMSSSTPRNLRAPGFAAGSTSTATSTATGNCSALLPGRRLPFRRSTSLGNAMSCWTLPVCANAFPIWRNLCRCCAARSFCRAAATGPSRSAPPRSTPQ